MLKRVFEIINGEPATDLEFIIAAGVALVFTLALSALVWVLLSYIF